MIYIFNLKNYASVTGENLFLTLDIFSKFIELYPSNLNNIFIAVPLIQLAIAKDKFKNLNIISQSVSSTDGEKTTGKVTASSLLDLGINYSIVNHSENRTNNLNKMVGKLSQSDLNAIVCIESLEEIIAIKDYKPFAIAYEPPELIATGNSVTNKTEIVEKFISIVKSFTLPFIGAGITTRADLVQAEMLGAKGVILASAFTLATDKFKKLEELPA